MSDRFDPDSSEHLASLSPDSEPGPDIGPAPDLGPAPDFGLGRDADAGPGQGPASASDSGPGSSSGWGSGSDSDAGSVAEAPTGGPRRRPPAVPIGRQGPRLAIIAAVVLLLALSGFSDRGRHPTMASGGAANGSAGGAASAGGGAAAGSANGAAANGAATGSGGASGGATQATVSTGGSADSASEMPFSAPAAALSSSWFCGGAGVTPSGFANGRLVVVNAGNGVLTGTIRFLSASGAPISRPVRVEPRNKAVLDEPAVPAGTYQGAIVDLDGGAAAVQQVVTGSEGTSTTACASSGSAGWYFPGGTTQVNSTLSLTLVNPYPADAIADLSFITEQGQENPADFQGLVVPAGGLIGIDLGGHLRDRASVATTVRLRVGQVVAFETQVVQAQTTAQKAANPAGATPWPPGVNVMLGSPSGGTAYWWPSGIDGPGLIEKYLLYNPTSQTADVSLGVALDQGSADPFQVSVSPFSVSEVSTNTESRIPVGIGHAAWMRSTNGVGVVAERVLFATSPSGHAGIAELLGSRRQSAQWVLPGDGTSTPSSESTILVVYNQGSESVTISVTTLGAGSDGFAPHPSQVVQPGRRYVLTPSSTGALLVAVSGRGQVVVEGDATASHGIGLSSAIGVPLT